MRVVTLFIILSMFCAGCSTPVASTITPVDTSPSFEQKCLTIGTSGEGSSFAGAIVFWRFEQLFALTRDQLVELPHSAGASPDIAVSPTHDQIAFHTVSLDAANQVTNATLWIVDSQNWGVVSSRQWQAEWDYLQGWSSNNELLLGLSPSKRLEGTVLALNNETGTGYEVVPDFPGIYFDAINRDPDRAPSWTMAYDLALTRVVYLQVPGSTGFPSAILLNLQTKQELWRMSYPKVHHAETAPVWSPTGLEFAVAGQDITFEDVVAKPELVTERHFDVYTVSRDGRVIRQTDFSRIYPETAIRNLSWSPDGQLIAFWMQPPGEAYLHLNILDTRTHKTRDYCVRNSGSGPAPVWAPDSQSLVVMSDDPDKLRHVVLDIASDTAIELSGVYDGLPIGSPVGWLRKKE